MRFIVDAQLPPGLATWIASHGHDARHLLDIGMLTAPDQAIWDKALEPGAVIVSKDRDFVEWAMSRRPSPQVVWLRLGNTPTNTLIKRLEGSSREILASLEAGALTVEIGK